MGSCHNWHLIELLEIPARLHLFALLAVKAQMQYRKKANEVATHSYCFPFFTLYIALIWISNVECTHK